MSWTSLAPLRVARAQIDATIAVRADALIIKLGPHTLAAAGWSVGTRIDIQVGTDEHIGIVRLVKDRHGWSLMKHGGSAGLQNAIVRVSKQLIQRIALPGAPDRLPPTPIELSIRDGVAEFRLPWLKRHEGAFPFAQDNVKTRDGGARKLNRAETHIGTANVLGGL